MNILYIHQYFVTPQEPGGTRSYWISQELIKRGHKVIMLTSTNDQHKDSQEVDIDGIHVIYLKNKYSNYMSSINRIRSFMRFVLLAIRKSFNIKDIDIVFATSTPLTIGIIALWLRFTRGWKYVFEVRDLWPEALIQEGGIKNKFLQWGLYKLEYMSYRFSTHIIALSPGMLDGIIKTGIAPKKCSMVPNMSKPDKFYPHEHNREIINKFNIDCSKFNLIHFGSMGICNGLSYITDAAKLAHVQGYSDLNFIFLGDGATLPTLKTFVEKNKLPNVQFLGNHKMSIVAEIVNCCDASITSFSNIPILATNSPNKLFDSLSAGKVIIVNSAGWTKDLVEGEGCGFYVDPENPQDLVNKLNKIKNNKTLISEMGIKSRNLSINVYDKSILSARVADIIEEQKY